MLSSETKLSILMTSIIAYTFSPGALWLWLSYEIESGSFPVDADSIGLPMAGFLFLWFVGWGRMIFAAFALAIYRRVLEQIELEGVK